MGLICKWCVERRRVSKPELVHYVDIRSSERHSSWFCSVCDSTVLWPNFAKSSPRVPKD